MSAGPTPVTLRGTHATLVPLSAAHADGLAEAARDGELWKLWYTSVPGARRMARRDRSAASACRRAARCCPSRVLDASGAHRRHDDLHEHRRHPPARRDRLAPGTRGSVQRSPLNTECKLMLLTHAFEALDCIAVEFRTHRLNTQSRRAIERLGAQLDGILRCAPARAGDGTLRDTAVYSITGGRVADGQDRICAGSSTNRADPAVAARPDRRTTPYDEKDAHGRRPVEARTCRRARAGARRRAGGLLGHAATRWRRTRRASASGCCPPSAASRAASRAAARRTASPRGRRTASAIAFVAKREQEGKKDEAPQLYVIAPDGGEARRVSDFAPGIEAFKWFPDGKRIAFVAWVWPELKGEKAQAKRHKEFKERKESGYATSEALYRFWDHNAADGPRAASARARRRERPHHRPVRRHAYELPRAEPDANAFDISPDGRRIVFAYDPQPRSGSTTATRWPSSRCARGKHRRRSRVDADWDFDAPRYSPDGERSPSSPRTQGKKHTMPAQLALLDAQRAAGSCSATRWDHAVQRAAALGRRRRGGATSRAEDRGRRHLWRFDCASAQRRGRDRRLGARLRRRAPTRSVDAADAIDHPARVHARRRSGAAAHRALQRRAAREVPPRRTSTRSRVPGAQGEPVQMWVVYPPGFDPQEEVPGAAQHPRRAARGCRRHLPLPLEHPGVRGAGLRGRLRQLPRLERLRPRVSRQHHAPLGRTGTAGRRGRHRLAAQAALGRPQARVRHRRQLRRLHGRVDERPREARPLPGLRVPRRLLRLGRRCSPTTPTPGSRASSARCVLGRPGEGAFAKPARLRREHAARRRS